MARKTMSQLATECARIYGENSMGYPPNIARMIVKEYFNQVFELLLTGSYYRLANFGEITIERKPRSLHKKLRNRHKPAGLLHNQYDYLVVIKSDRMDKYEYSFEISSTLGKKIYHAAVTKKIQFIETFS